MFEAVIKMFSCSHCLFGVQLDQNVMMKMCRLLILLCLSRFSYYWIIFYIPTWQTQWEKKHDKRRPGISEHCNRVRRRTVLRTQDDIAGNISDNL